MAGTRGYDMCIYLFTRPELKSRLNYLIFCAIGVKEHGSNLPVVACYDVQSH